MGTFSPESLSDFLHLFLLAFLILCSSGLGVTFIYLVFFIIPRLMVYSHY